MAMETPEHVILKGFANEPLDVLAVADRGDAIEVVHDATDEPMPFHADSVFKFDQSLFSELKRAADSNDADQLRVAWGMATPFRRSA
jgi:hypothetical protein